MVKRYATVAFVSVFLTGLLTAAGYYGFTNLFAAVSSDVRCDNHVKIDTAATGSTELVALTAGQTIYVCGYTFVSTTAVNVKFVYGTGSNCATGATDLTGAMAMADKSGVVNPVATGTAIFKTASANALCINQSGAQQTSGHVTYGKF